MLLPRPMAQNSPMALPGPMAQKLLIAGPIPLPASVDQKLPLPAGHSYEDSPHSLAASANVWSSRLIASRASRTLASSGPR